MNLKFYLTTALVLTTAFCRAQTTWNGSVSTDWNNAANWSNNTVPNLSLTVIIPPQVPATYDTSSHAATVARVSSCEYWNAQRLNGASNVTLTFSYDEPCYLLQLNG